MRTAGTWQRVRDTEFSFNSTTCLEFRSSSRQLQLAIFFPVSVSGNYKFAEQSFCCVVLPSGRLLNPLS